MSKKKIATHNGKFHSDDIFAVATLLLYLNDDAEVFRTRDENVIESADYVVDVGRLNNPDENRYDHHQMEGAGKRKNGVPYASFGLVWKRFGEELCSSSEAAKMIDVKIVQSVDALDNGLNIYEPVFSGASPYLIQDLHNASLPTWTEEKDFNTPFFEMVSDAKKILKREIKIAQDKLASQTFLKEEYTKSENKKILILDKHVSVENIPKELSELLMVVSPRDNEGSWQIGVVRDSQDSYTYHSQDKIKLPKSWAGLEDEDLVKVTGVEDAIFCHRGLFMCVAKSKEGALALAKKALEA